MTTSEEAQQTKYKAIAGCIIAVILGGLWAFYIWCGYAYQNAEYAERYRSVLNKQEKLEQWHEQRSRSYEQRLADVEKFANSLRITLELQKKIPTEQ
jgi:hypothetical protein